jgi:hypothetical protein
MLEIKANLIHKPTTMVTQDCRIEKIIELTRDEFIALTHRPNADYGFITENCDLMGEWDGSFHCLLALNKESGDGILIEAEGYDSVRYGAFMSRAKDFVELDMRQIADFLLTDITPDEEAGDICIYPEDIGESTGAGVWESSVIARMFRRTLEEHPAVSGVTLVGDCLAVTTKPAQTQDGLKLRDVLLLGSTENVYMVHDTADVGFIPARHFDLLGGKGLADHAVVLDAVVAEIRPGAYGPEIVLTGVDPQALSDLDQAAADHLSAGAVTRQGMQGP